MFFVITYKSTYLGNIKLIVLLADRLRKAIGEKADFAGPTVSMLKCVEGEVELGDEPDQHVACWNMYNYFGK